jgi:hypothetical protein
MTPAQASGHPDFVTDWPVQGPTDPGIRAADCWFAQNRLPARPACVDCEGTTPMRNTGLLSERISFGGVGTRGFALAAAGSPDIWSALNGEQQTWVTDTLTRLNDKIVASSSKCTTWGSSTGSIACFQAWFNSTINPRQADQPKPLRTDGAFDQSTLDALIMTAGFRPADFPTPFPKTYAGGSTIVAEKKGLSTGAIAGIAAVGATVVGGIIYAATRGSKKRRK